jgi:sulfite dehydrogenase
LIALVLLGGAVGWAYMRGKDRYADTFGTPPKVATPVATPAPQAPEKPERLNAKRLFVDTCAACHALDAAGASGPVGPDLDAAAPSAAKVRRWIRTGSSDGIMQPGLLEGDDARRVADFVARSAGAAR